MATQFKIRKNANIWTDQRAKIILEVLGAMRVVKYFSYEIPFLKSSYLENLAPVILKSEFVSQRFTRCARTS